MNAYTQTWQVQIRQGIGVSSHNHVGYFIHDSLLCQVLTTMLALSQSGDHLYSCCSKYMRSEVSYL